MIDVHAILEDLRQRTNLGPAKTSFIEMNRSAPREPALALLVFVEDRDEPFAFVKATSDADRTNLLDREHANLDLLQRRGDERFRATVPEPLYRSTLGNVAVLATTAKPGTRMKNFPPASYYGSRPFRSHFAAAIEWLGAFHETLVGEAPAEPAAERIESSIARFRETHRVSTRLGALLDETTRALRAASFPLSPRHGDFCTANIVIPDERRIFVIDWEYPVDPGWPLADLLYFVASTWCVPYRKGGEALRENFGRLFFESHAFGDLVVGAVARHLDRLTIGRELALPLSVISWVAYANRKHDELRTFVAAGAEDRAARHMPLIMIEDGTCLNLEILAEHRQRYLEEQ